MNKIKLVLTDLDGTAVYPGSHKVTPSVVEAINQAQKAGVKVSAVTGRPFIVAKKILAGLGVRDLCIVDGGAAIIKPLNGELVWSRRLPSNTIKQSIEIFSKYTEKIDYGEGLVKISEAQVRPITVDQLSVWAAVKADEAEEVKRKLLFLPNVAVHTNLGPNNDFNLCGVQVTNKEADKKHGVKSLLEILKIEKNEVLAIGDADNDLPLFEGSGVKVAMGNATETLKEKADYIVGSLENDGFVEAINKYVLN